MSAAQVLPNIAFGRVFRIGLATMAVAASAPSFAVDNRPRTEFRVADELSGIVANQTLTPLGQEFYSRFNDFWRENADFEDYSFVVGERHSRRYGSQIVVVYRQKQVFVGNLPYRYGQIRAFSADAADKVHTAIVGLSLRVAADRDPDMADDEF